MKRLAFSKAHKLKASQAKTTLTSAPWFTKPTGKISYYEFLNSSNKPLKTQVSEFSRSVEAGTKLDTTEKMVKSLLALPSMMFGEAFTASPVVYDSSPNISDGCMRDIENFKVRDIPDDFFLSVFGHYDERSWRQCEKSEIKDAFMFPLLANRNNHTYNVESDSEAKISYSVFMENLEPVEMLLNAIGVKCSILPQQKLSSPFGKPEQHRENFSVPDFLISSNNRNFPFEIKKPFATKGPSEYGISNKLLKRMVLYMISSNTNVGILTSYFDTMVFHLSKEDIESAHICSNGEVSFSVGIKKIKNKEEYVTMKVALISLIIR